jgi:hypothetical protein
LARGKRGKSKLLEFPLPSGEWIMDLSGPGIDVKLKEKKEKKR